MKRIALGIIVTSVCVALMGIVLHEVSPRYMTALMANPTVRVATMAVHNFFRNPYPTPKQPSQPTKSTAKKERLFTADDLKKYDGREGSKGLYLAILGRVYNVKKGKNHYGPGGGYEFFAGMVWYSTVPAYDVFSKGHVPHFKIP